MASSSLNIRPFATANVVLWFKQVEINFARCKIESDEDKFAHLIAAIDPHILNPISDIIFTPPATDKYIGLKSRLIAEYTDSEQVTLRKLLSDLQLGDQKPSALLHEMQILAAGKVDDAFLKTLWSQRLPLNIQAILSSSSEKLTELAQLADKIAEVFRAIPQVSATTGAPSVTMDVKLANMQKQIDQLCQQVARLSRMRSVSPRRAPPRQNQGRQNSSRLAVGDKPLVGWCHVHRRYGEKAFSCRPLCTFDTQKN